MTDNTSYEAFAVNARDFVQTGNAASALTAKDTNERIQARKYAIDITKREFDAPELEDGVTVQRVMNNPSTLDNLISRAKTKFSIQSSDMFEANPAGIIAGAPQKELAEMAYDILPIETEYKGQLMEHLEGDRKTLVEAHVLAVNLESTLRAYGEGKATHSELAKVAAPLIAKSIKQKMGKDANPNIVALYQSTRLEMLYMSEEAAAGTVAELAEESKKRFYELLGDEKGQAEYARSSILDRANSGDEKLRSKAHSYLVTLADSEKVDSEETA